MRDVADGYRPRQVFGSDHASTALIGSWRQPLRHGIVVPSCASDFVITSLQVLQKKKELLFGTASAEYFDINVPDLSCSCVGPGTYANVLTSSAMNNTSDLPHGHCIHAVVDAGGAAGDNER